MSGFTRSMKRYRCRLIREWQNEMRPVGAPRRSFKAIWGDKLDKSAGSVKNWKVRSFRGKLTRA